MVCTVGIEALQAPACYKLRKCTPFRSGKARSLTVQAVKLQSVDEPVSRRQALQGLAMLAASGAIPQQALAAGKSAEVGRSVDATPPRQRSDQGLKGNCLPFNLQQQSSDSHKPQRGVCCLQLSSSCWYRWIFGLQARQIKNSCEPCASKLCAMTRSSQYYTTTAKATMHIGNSSFPFLMLAYIDCSFCCWL